MAVLETPSRRVLEAGLLSAHGSGAPLSRCEAQPFPRSSALSGAHGWPSTSPTPKKNSTPGKDYFERRRRMTFIPSIGATGNR